MIMPSGTWWFGWQGLPPREVHIAPGDVIPEAVMQQLTPAHPLYAVCMKADPSALSAALTVALAPGPMIAAAQQTVAAIAALAQVKGALPPAPR